MPSNKLFFFLLIVAFSSCTAPDQNENLPMEASFFDLEAYFAQEVERLAEMSSVRKVTLVDGKGEENTVDQPNMEENLAVFVEAGINKIAWLDKYSVDSTFSTNKELVQLDYQAIDETMKTRSLQIFFQASKVDSILIVRSSSSVVASMEQHLNYYPLSGYSIENRQKTTLSDEHVLAVKVQFLP